MSRVRWLENGVSTLRLIAYCILIFRYHLFIRHQLDFCSIEKFLNSDKASNVVREQDAVAFLFFLMASFFSNLFLSLVCETRVTL